MEIINKAYKKIGLKNSIFSNRNFMLLFIGKLVSNLGDMIYIFSISWFILDITGSAVYSGIFAMVGLVPTIIMMPFGGVIADNFNRKNIMVYMDLIRGVTLILLAIVFHYYNNNLSVLYIAAVILGFSNALFRPACSALIPNIVDKSHLTRANSLNAITENGSNIVGVLAGGLLYSLVGIKIILFFNGISFIISGISEMFIDISHTIKSNKDLKKFNQGAFKIFISEVIDGFSYLRTQKSLYVLFLFAIGLNFLLAPLSTIFLPYIFNQLLKTKLIYLSYVNVSVAVGYIFGAMVISILPTIDKFFKRIMGGIVGEGVFLLTIAIPIFPPILNKLSAIQITICYIFVAFFFGLVVSIVNISLGVVFQKIVSDEFRGRVSSLLSMLALAAMPFGYLIGGILVETFSIHIVILVTSIILIALSLSMCSNKHLKEL